MAKFVYDPKIARIKQLEAENQELRLQCLAHETQAREAYAAQQRAEAKLATNDEIVRRAERIIDLQNELHDEVARLKSELSDADIKRQHVSAKLGKAVAAAFHCGYEAGHSDAENGRYYPDSAWEASYARETLAALKGQDQ